MQTCGGSNRLVRLLNRFGACASSDTHARYVQYRVDKSKKEGPMSGFPDNAFIVASADNLDYIHSYARVYCGNQQSSWNGTTVQLVQPWPSKLLDNVSPAETSTHTQATNTENELIRHPQTPASATLETRLQACLSKRSHSTQSPINSPGKHSPAPKRRRWMRTGTEEKQTSTDTSNQSPPSTCTPNAIDSQLQNPNLSIGNFRLTEEESKSMAQLREMCNEYMLQKMASTTHAKTLIDFQTYFNLYNNQPPPECSNIIYYKVLSQRCDDKETLLNIINDLYHEFVATKKKKWILLEGDQATYERLQSLKTEYGNDLSWMVPISRRLAFLKKLSRSVN